MFDDIIIPGAHGVGTRGFTAIDGGYGDAADALVKLYDEGRSVNMSDYHVKRVMDYYGARSLNELKIKRRGW